MQKKAMLLTAALGGVTALEIRKRMHQRNANWLRNAEGVGPAHQPGSPRGEERVLNKKPDLERTTELDS